MKLSPDDKSCLEQLYQHYAVPTDQLPRHPLLMGRIRAGFIRLTGIDCTAADLIKYMVRRRKQKDWPKLGDRARKFPPALQQIQEQIGSDVLAEVYVDLNIPLDWFLGDNRLAQQYADMIASKTGYVFHAADTVAAAMALRKRGRLPKLLVEQATKKTPSTRKKFGDIQIVDRQHNRRANA